MLKKRIEYRYTWFPFLLYLSIGASHRTPLQKTPRKGMSARIPKHIGKIIFLLFDYDRFDRAILRSLSCAILLSAGNTVDRGDCDIPAHLEYFGTCLGTQLTPDTHVFFYHRFHSITSMVAVADSVITAAISPQLYCSVFRRD